jgi:cytochrome b6-f complex iron-sulfur subunit
MKNDSADQTRRRFLNWFLGTSLGALCVSIAYPVIRYLTPPEATSEPATNEVEVGLTNDRAFVEKGYVITRLGGKPVIVIRVSPTDFRAFSAVCTHLDCIVGYRISKHLIWCNCHNGRYNLQGQVVGGPPPKPLQRFGVHLVSKPGMAAQTVVVSRSRA